MYVHQAMVMHAFNPTTLKAERQVDLCEFEATWSTKRVPEQRVVTQRNTVQKTNRKKKSAFKL